MAKPKLIPPVKNGQKLELAVEALVSSGDGIARRDGYTLFIPAGLPGDVVLAEVVKTTPRFGVTRILRRISDSPHRTDSPCPAFPRCGGCDFLCLDYSQQMEFKTRAVMEALQRIGKTALPERIEIFPAERTFFYRNKGSFAVQSVSGKLRIGFYREGTHIVEDANACDALLPKIVEVKEWLRGLLLRHRVSIYDERKHRGFVRGLVVRHSAGTGETLAGIVTNAGKIPAALLGDLADGAEKLGLAGVVHNVNPERTNIILGKTNRTLWGRDHLLDRLGGLDFRVSLSSFFQVNPFQAERLYDIVRDWADASDRYVVDAYCGTGAIGLWLARAGARVAGIEESPDAVADAKHNAALNGIENCEFLRGDTDSSLAGFSADSGIAVIVLDPPRKGLSDATLDSVLRIAPPRIIYVSCNPATLARDVARLDGYRIGRLCVLDMFPQTAHVESVVLLEKA